MKRVYCLMILLLCATSVLLAQKKAEIEFKQTKYDFHEIAEENGDVSHVFTFINKGNAPLIITRASANCGWVAVLGRTSATPSIWMTNATAQW